MCFKVKFIYKINKDLIFDYMKKHDIGIDEFCNICNITLKEFSDLMKNDSDIDTIIFAKINKVLKVKFVDLLI